MTFLITGNVLKKYEGNDVSVTIPPHVTVIADYAFSHARSIKQIILNKELTEIGNDAFYDCEGLEELEIPDSVYYIGSGLFARCQNLKRVRFPARLTALPKITFFQCVQLSEVILPAALTRIQRACFEQCRSLVSLNLPAGLKVIEDNAFDDCVSLREIRLPQSLREIGNNAFFGCTSLRSLTLPESLESAGKGAFETRGRLSLQAPDSFRVRSQMLDNNWNLNWNFGANGRYNGKNEENYQLVLSRLMNVDLNEWKPEARCILAVNYLESGCPETEQYDEYIRDHQYECMEMIVARQRWHALNCGLDREVIDENILPDYLSRITDRTEKAILLGRQRKRTDSFDDLMNLF